MLQSNVHFTVVSCNACPGIRVVFESLQTEVKGCLGAPGHRALLKKLYINASVSGTGKTWTEDTYRSMRIRVRKIFSKLSKVPLQRKYGYTNLTATPASLLMQAENVNPHLTTANKSSIKNHTEMFCNR